MLIFTDEVEAYEGRTVTVVGTVVMVRVGEKSTFFLVTDFFGRVAVVSFEPVDVQEGDIVLVSGRAEKTDTGPRIVARNVYNITPSQELALRLKRLYLHTL